MPGKVIRVLSDHVLIDIGYKQEGIIDILEFSRDDDGNREVRGGDELNDHGRAESCGL